MTRLLQSWNTYWFRSSSLTNLAICRIIIVGFQLFLLVKVDTYSQNTYFKLSILPDSLYDPLPILSLLTWPFGWGYRPSFEFLETVYWLILAVGFLALIGFRTKCSLLIFAVGNIFLQAFMYSFGDFHHPEGLMMIAILTLSLGPAGESLSVDNLQYRLQQNSKRGKFETFSLMDENSIFALWPLLLIQWILVLIYLSGATIKLSLSGFDWINGYTLQYYLLLDGLRYGSDLSLWLAQYHVIALLLSWTTILFEGSFFLVLIFPPLIYFHIPLGVAFHTGIYLTQKAFFFQFIAIYAVFIPWVNILKIFSQKTSFLHFFKKKPTILFDGKCIICIRAMTVLCYFDWFDCLNFFDLENQRVIPAVSYPGISFKDYKHEMHCVLPDTSVQKGFFAFRSILYYLPPLWPLLIVFYFPLASVIGPKLYKSIAARRLRFQRCDVGICCSMHFMRK